MPNLYRLLVRTAVLLASVLGAVSMGWAASPQPASHVTLSAAPSVAQVAPGGQFVVAVVMNHAEGWHSHTNDPKPPASWDGFVAIPTVVATVEGQNALVGPVQWPKSHDLFLDLVGTGTPEKYGVFEGRAVVLVPVLVPADATGEVRVTFEVSFQACDDTTCDMPLTERVSVAVPIAATTAPGMVADDFAGFDAAVFERVADFAVPGSAPASGLVKATSSSTFFGIPLPEGGGILTMLILFALACLGGLILNLTPCVLPVIPLKIMAISQHAGTPGRSLFLGSWMAAGVVFFWVAIGVPAMLVTAWSDASQLFAIWWVTFGLGVVIAVMAVGMMGVFQITLPQSVYLLNPKADSARGSFAYGVMTAVLGLPCFGFVVGALSAATATLPKVAILLIYTGIGVGMALPYLVLAVKPGWLRQIPRTGPASELVKQVMGLLLLAAGIYFIGSGLIGLVAGVPWTGRLLHWWAVALCGVVAGAWLLWRTFSITKSPARRAVFSLVAVFVAGVGVWFVADLTALARSTRWVPYTPTAFEAARRSGKVIVVDFTAEWCINCKALKARVLSREPAKWALYRDDVVLMTVDYTGKNPDGQALQDSLGRTGIPLLAIFPKGDGPPWLSNAYTGPQVVDALNQATGPVVAGSLPEPHVGR